MDHILFNPTEAAADAMKAAKERNEIPFSRYGGSSAIRLFQSESEWDSYSDSLGKYRNTKIDFAKEVGSLDDSSIVAAAIRWLGKNLPEAPWLVTKTDEAGKKTNVLDHPLLALLKRPSRYYSGQTLWKSFAANWIISGNFYLQKQRNAFGQVIGLRYWPFYQIRPHWPGMVGGGGWAGGYEGGALDSSSSEFVDYYQVKVDTVVYRIPVEDVVHFRDGLNPATRCGISPLNSVLREIYTDNEIANYSAITLKNLGVAPFAVVPKGEAELSEENAKVIKDTLQRSITGDKRGGFPVMSMAMEFPNLGMKAKDMSLGTMGGRPETRIPAVIGINAIVLYLEAGLDRSIFHNVSEAREEAIEQYLMPLRGCIAEEMEAQLLPEWGDTAGLSIRSDYSEVRALQPDADKLFERWGKLYIQGGVKRSKLLAETGQQFDETVDNVYYMSANAGLITPEERSISAPAASVDVAPETKAAPKLTASGMQPTQAEIDAASSWLDEAVPGAKGILEAEPVN
jgi:HK97 family phage portal protein